MSSPFRFPIPRGLALAARALALPALLATLAPRALSSDVVVPSGFNAETRLAAGPLVAVLADGTAVLSTGFFGAEQLSLQHADGTVSLYAQGLGSLSGLAQSPASGVLVAGDSFSAVPLLVIEDLNDDGDALDAGEVAPHPVALPVLQGSAPPLPFSVGFRPGAPADELYVSASTPGVVLRIAGGTAAVFADGFDYPACMAWGGDTLYMAHNTTTFAGEVYALTDGNHDGDALDPGEKVLFASGLSGASGLVRASDGHLYLSGGFGPDFSGGLARLAPDLDRNGTSDAIDPAWAWGLGSFSSSLVLIEGAGGFAPGTAADGELWCGEFLPDFGPPLAGNVIVRSAPHAALSLTGQVANNQSFSLHLQGETGSQGVAVFALDQEGVTLHGIGDLALGFGAPYLIAPLGAIGVSGQVSLTLTLHEVGGAVGLPFTLQAFAQKLGEVGCSNALDLVVLP